MKAFVDDLHAKDMHFVPIIDPGIYAGPTDADKYPALVEGLKQDVFIKVHTRSKRTGRTLLAGVALELSFKKLIA